MTSKENKFALLIVKVISFGLFMLTIVMKYNYFFMKVH